MLYRHNRARLFVSVVLICILLFTGCGNDPDAMQFAPQTGHVDADELDTSPLEVFAASPEAIAYPLVEAPEAFTMLATDVALSGTQPLLDACAQATGVSIVPQPVTAEEYYYEYNKLIDAGDLPDLMYAAPDGLTDPDQEILIQLDELLAAYAPNYLTAANNCYDGLGALYNPQYGIMRMYSFYEEPQLTPSVGIGIREDWLTALGCEPPETYDDYYAFLTAVKDRYNPELPFRMLISGTSGYDVFNAGFGVSIGSRTAWGGFYQENGVVKYGPMEDGYTDYVTLMHQWRTEELITAKYLDYADLYTNSYLMELSLGESAVFFVPLSSWDKLESMCDFPITAGQDPVVSAGETTHFSTESATAVYGPSFSVTTACENPELAVQTADWFYTEAAVQISNSIHESSDNTAVSETPDETVQAPAEQPNAVLFSSLNGLSGIYTEERVSNAESAYRAVLDVWTQQKDTDYMLPTSLQLTDEEAEDFSMTMVSISSFADGKTAQFISGDAPLSEIDGMREKLSEYGIQDAIDILQTALARG